MFEYRLATRLGVRDHNLIVVSAAWSTSLPSFFKSCLTNIPGGGGGEEVVACTSIDNAPDRKRYTRRIFFRSGSKTKVSEIGTTLSPPAGLLSHYPIISYCILSILDDGRHVYWERTNFGVEAMEIEAFTHREGYTPGTRRLSLLSKVSVASDSCS